VITVSRGDLKRLCPGVYFNDNLIDLRVKHLVFGLPPSDQSRLHAFSCMFYTKLLEQGNKKKGHALVARWTKNFDVFAKDFIFIPVNESAHWSLAVIAHPGHISRKATELFDLLPQCKYPSPCDCDEDEEEDQTCILHMDSLSLHSSAKIGDWLKQYLYYEWQARKRPMPVPDRASRCSSPVGPQEADDRDMLALFRTKIRIVRCKVPKQPNAHDCGVYVVKFRRWSWMPCRALAATT